MAMNLKTKKTIPLFFALHRNKLSISQKQGLKESMYYNIVVYATQASLILIGAILLYVHVVCS